MTLCWITDDPKTGHTTLIHGFITGNTAIRYGKLALVKTNVLHKLISFKSMTINCACKYLQMVPRVPITGNKNGYQWMWSLFSWWRLRYNQPGLTSFLQRCTEQRSLGYSIYYRKKSQNLTFSDVIVSLQVNGSLTTSLSKKHTHSNRIMPFDSNPPALHKIGGSNTMFQWINTLSGSQAGKLTEKNKIS